MKLFFFLLLSLPFAAFARVEIAFVEILDSQGQPLQLEPGGRFAHTAISYRGKWLQAHPIRGVELVSRARVEELGVIREIVALPDRAEPSEAEVAKYLGKPFDSALSWSDDAIYSSELVAKLLGIKPMPMAFEAAIWPARFRLMRGQLGISPDDIFQILRKSGSFSARGAGLCSGVYAP